MHDRQSLLAIYIATYSFSCVVMWALIYFWMPLPPRTVVLGIDAGSAESSTYRTAMRYRTSLEVAGLEVVLEELHQNKDAREWMSRTSSTHLAGFMPGLLFNRRSNVPVNSLATVGIQPLWIATSSSGVKEIADLRGKRIAIDRLDGATFEMMRTVLAQARIKSDEVSWVQGNSFEAARQLFRREVDVMVTMKPPDAPSMQMLFTEPGIAIVQNPYAGAIAQRDPRMQAVVMPQGAIELHGNVPPHDVILLAVRNELVVREGMHPALQRALLDSAVSVHSVASFMQRETEYPEFRTALPMTDAAKAYARGDRPWLELALPYWWAQLASVVLYVVLPVLLATTLLLIWIPRILGWKVDNLLMRYYGELYFLEDDLYHSNTKGAAAQRELLARLDRLEHEVSTLNLPDGYLDRWYRLRTDLTAIRLRILKLDSPN